MRQSILVCFSAVQSDIVGHVHRLDGSFRLVAHGSGTAAGCGRHAGTVRRHRDCSSQARTVASINLGYVGSDTCQHAYTHWLELNILIWIYDRARMVLKLFFTFRYYFVGIIQLDHYRELCSPNYTVYAVNISQLTHFKTSINSRSSIELSCKA